MSKKIVGIMFVMKASEEEILFLLLASDGTINRMGVGNYSTDPADQTMYIGSIHPSPFDNIVALVSDDLVRHMGGSYRVQNIKGETCSLRVLLLYATDEQGTVDFEKGESTGIEFVYGSESAGPPPTICKLVTTAVELTNPWYEQEKEMVRKSRQ